MLLKRVVGFLVGLVLGTETAWLVLTQMSSLQMLFLRCQSHSTIFI